MTPDKPRARIAQMTWYQSQNYGSVLQAYALQRTLIGFGADARLINYDPAPWQHRNQSSFRKSKPVRAARMFQQRMMGTAPFVTVEKDASFKAFAADHILETEPVATQADFDALNARFDAFVCGSDQVWSPRCFDPRYYLNFVSQGRLRVAYAPSFGCDALPEGASVAIASLLSGFDSLSAREAQGARMVEGLCGRACQVVCDPVVLLSTEEWRRAFHKVGNAVSATDYCLCYFLGRSEDNWARARMIAKQKGLALVIVPVFNGDAKRGGTVPASVGPLEFLSLIANASYVCTDSFHGLVFSTILERDFSVFERFEPGSSASQNVRIENFLSMTGLGDRLLHWGVADSPDTCDVVDFASVRQRISALRANSLEYLRGALAPVLAAR